MKRFVFTVAFFSLFALLAACGDVELEDPFTQAENVLAEVAAQVPAEVDDDFVVLPKVHGEYHITWESENPDIITADGDVNQPVDEAVTVTLVANTAVPAYDDEVSREIEVTVLPAE